MGDDIANVPARTQRWRCPVQVLPVGEILDEGGSLGVHVRPQLGSHSDSLVWVRSKCYLVGHEARGLGARRLGMPHTMSGTENPPAVLFDVDGTLVDSNYLHVHAWYRAFSDLRIPVQSWKIHRSIGMDGAKLLETLAADADEDARKQLKELHTQYYQDTTSLLSPLPGAREILDRLDSLGLQVVLATSAPEDELATLRAVLDRDDLISAATSAEDVETAKPKPDLVEIALAEPMSVPSSPCSSVMPCGTPGPALLPG